MITSPPPPLATLISPFLTLQRTGSIDALKQGYVGVKYKEPLNYVLPTKQHVTFFVSQGTDFQQTWLTLTSDIDTTYTPALIPLPAERPMSDLDLRSLLTLANLATASGGEAGLPPVPALTSLLASRESNNETLTAATMAAFGERMIKVNTVSFVLRSSTPLVTVVLILHHHRHLLTLPHPYTTHLVHIH